MNDTYIERVLYEVMNMMQTHREGSSIKGTYDFEDIYNLLWRIAELDYVDNYAESMQEITQYLVENL